MASTGIAILDQDRQLVHSENVKLGVGTDYDRIVELYKTFRRLMLDFPPSIVAWEMVSVFTMPQSAIKLAMVSAASFCATSEARTALGIEPPYLVTYVATQVKKVGSGGGRASKQEVMDGVEERFGESFTTDDEADAFCVAIAAHLLHEVAVVWRNFCSAKLGVKEIPTNFEDFHYDKAKDKLVMAFLKQRLPDSADLPREAFEVVISRFMGPNILSENNHAESKSAWAAIKGLVRE